MQLSKQNNNRKRKERPLTSYFTPLATVVTGTALSATVKAAAVDEQQEKVDGIGEKRSSSVDVDVNVESTMPAVVQQQSTTATKQAQASSSKKASASNPKNKNKNKVDVEVNLNASDDDDDDDDDIALSDLKQTKTKKTSANKGRKPAAIATSAKEKKRQQEPVVAERVAIAKIASSVHIEATRQTSSNSDISTDRCSTTNVSSGNENTAKALQDCTNANSSAVAELEEEATRKLPKNNGHTEETSEKKPFAAIIRNNTTSRSRSLPPSTNVVHQLFSRSLHGAGRTKNGSVSAPPQAWKIPSWIDLCPGNSSARNSGIKSLAWDDMGVLLAAYCDDRCIRIYDWDMVVAANVRGRNLRTRQAAYSKKDTECLMIEPILVFPFSFGHVSLLKWNPFNPDELAMANSLTGDVYLYDINQVCARQEERMGQGTPYRKLAASEGGAVSELVFLQKGKRLVLCQNDLLYCWSIGVGASMPLQLWKFRWKAISSIVPLGRDILVLGSKQGHLALLNWKKMQRAAFSFELTPTLLDEWVSYKGLEVPSSYAMGIQHLRIENDSDLSTDGDHWGHCRLIWGTACGWVLSATVTSATTRMGRSCIHYSTKPIRCVKIKAEAADEADDKKGPIYQTVEEAKRSWSYNGGVVVAGSTKSALCWEKVPEVIKILPRHHDKRVLEDTGPRFVAGSDTRPTLMWMRTFGSGSNGIVYSVPLSKRKGPATAVAIHPSNEWIIVGTATNGLYAINGRSHIKNARES